MEVILSYCFYHNKYFWSILLFKDERCLRIVYNDKIPHFIELLEKMVLSLFTNKIFYNLQLKCSRGQMVSEIMKGFFQFRNKKPWNFRQRSQFPTHPAWTIFSRTESIKIWKLTLGTIKEIESLWEFKKSNKALESLIPDLREYAIDIFRIGIF